MVTLKKGNFYFLLYLLYVLYLPTEVCRKKMTWYLGFALKYFSKEKIRMDKANAENLDNC